jgi:urea transporter
MNSPWSGFLIWFGLIVQSPFTALCSLWATGWATWTAFFWDLPRARFEAGLYGYSNHG